MATKRIFLKAARQEAIDTIANFYRKQYGEELNYDGKPVKLVDCFLDADEEVKFTLYTNPETRTDIWVVIDLVTGRVASDTVYNNDSLYMAGGLDLFDLCYGGVSLYDEQLNSGYNSDFEWHPYWYNPRKETNF